MSAALCLFTHDLRLDDNRVLLEAQRHNAILPLYVVDERWFKPIHYSLPSMGAERWQFTRQAVQAFDEQLSRYGQHLTVLMGDVVECVSAALLASDADTVITCRPKGWLERQQLAKLLQLNPSLNVTLVDNDTLFEFDDSWLGSGLAKQYTPFRKQAERSAIGTVTMLPQALPPPPKGDALDMSSHHLCVATNELANLTGGNKTSPASGQFLGGEKTAKKHVHSYFASGAASSYKQTRNELSGWDTSSKWSPWLAQGSLSARWLYQTIEDYEASYGANDSTQWLKVELFWREYFQWLALKLGNDLFAVGGVKNKRLTTSFYPERFKRWCQGNTPYPLVNACMKELSKTGFMSNRGRQLVASCLVNELEVDWRYGAAWFEHKLIDYNVGSNWGNWQYIAGVGVDPRGGRRFDLDKQQRDFDPDFEYVKQWLGDDFIASTQCRIDSLDYNGWPLLHDIER